MTCVRLCAALVLLAAPAGSATPCRGDHQLGQRIELELISVTADRVSLTDVSAYRSYDVAIQSEVDPSRLDRVTTYVQFSAHRSAKDSFGREQVESLGEFYPVY